MAIYDPSPFLTKTDRRLILLLSKLILDAEGVEYSSNRSNGSVDLTFSESQELLELLESFLESKRFQESAYLLEGLFSGGSFHSKNFRDIYLSWRRFHGKSRALATDQWELFLSRLGVAPRFYGATPWYRSGAAPMSLGYFLKMEQRLATAAGITPRVRELILSYVRAQFGYIAAVRNEQIHLMQGQVAAKPKSILARLRKDSSQKIGAPPISTTKIAATMTIVLDLSVAYTTRDWSVASFLSTIAGSAPAAILD